MKKRLLPPLILSLLLTACGGARQPQESVPAPAAPAVTTVETQKTAPAFTPLTEALLAGTCWTAVDENGASLPDGAWADLTLRDDGTGRLRDVAEGSYRQGPEVSWTVEDGALVLSGASGTLTGRLADGILFLEQVGRSLHLVPSSPLTGGDALCLADLEGTWQLISLEAEGETASAQEAGVSSRFTVENRWSGTEAIPLFTCRYASAEGDVLFFEAAGETQRRTLYDGCENGDWSLALHPREAQDFSLRATLTDPDTLLVEIIADGETASLSTYRRPPETPEEVVHALEQATDASLLLYWPDPSPVLQRQLADVDTVAVEEGPSLLLLAGAEEHLVLRLYAWDPASWEAPEEGEPLPDLSDPLFWREQETVYCAPLLRGELRLFSLSIPEGMPHLCLSAELDGEESFFPITAMDGYEEVGWMYLDRS